MSKRLAALSEPAFATLASTVTLGPVQSGEGFTLLVQRPVCGAYEVRCTYQASRPSWNVGMRKRVSYPNAFIKFFDPRPGHETEFHLVTSLDNAKALLGGLVAGYFDKVEA